MKVAIGLGSSLGSRKERLARTIARLGAHPDLTLLRVSRWYRSPPLAGGTARGWFLNAVALFECTVAPHELLVLCRQLEQQEGRRRALYWGDRTLDLDILCVEGFRADTPELRVPHPAIADRPFVYVPLLEVWPDAMDPRTGRRYADLPAPSPRRMNAVGVLAHTRRTAAPRPLAGTEPAA